MEKDLVKEFVEEEKKLIRARLRGERVPIYPLIDIPKHFSFDNLNKDDEWELI